MVEVKANIEENGLGSWLIRIEDSFEKKENICNDMDEFAFLLQTLSQKYEGEVKVLWSKDENLSQENFLAVQAAMNRLQEKLEKESL